jgi:hypothetical protein
MLIQMFYSSNFDEQNTFQKGGFREFNKTIDDPCAMQQRQEDNNKKLKFMTTNHRDLLDGRSTMNYFGMTVKDKLFVPAENMDAFSELRQGQTGNVMTNCNVKNEYGQLPLPTMPSRYQMSHGDIQTEDSMRNIVESNRKTCNPKDSAYYNRHFYLFDDKQGIETPNALNSIQSSRVGVSTRR